MIFPDDLAFGDELSLVFSEKRRLFSCSPRSIYPCGTMTDRATLIVVKLSHCYIFVALYVAVVLWVHFTLSFFDRI